MPAAASNVAPPKFLGRALLLSAIVLAAVSAFPAAAQGQQQPTGQQVRAAILRAVEAIRLAQRPDGTWPDYAQEGGVTALATYALLAAGVSPDDKGVAAALEHLRRIPNQSTYVVALKTLAFASALARQGTGLTADPRKYRAEVQSCADWLVGMQNATGAWGYGRPAGAPPATPPPEAGLPREGEAEKGLKAVRTEAELKRAYERPDMSNTQFAILALSEADRAGASVPADVWKKADRHLRVTQLPGGGWGYVFHDPDASEAYGSMTAAAVAGLYLCHDRLAKSEPAEQSAERLASIEKGVAWIVEHYSLSENPNRALAWYYFWLYGLERAGVTSGRRTFGNHDWFREGTALLVGGQRPDGTWTDRLYQDALCLLFLAKGYKPLLVQRMELGSEWRRDPRDLDHLVQYLDKRVGGDPVAWQTVSSDAPLEDLLAAPILHLCGRGAIRMLAGSVPHLKEYIEQGGLIVMDADGGDAAFTESVRRMMAEMFPESKFEPVAADHPLFRAAHRVAPISLEAMNVGCRAAVILAPKGLADGWAAGDPLKPNDALALGENLALYATGASRLPDRLAAAAVMQLPPDQPPPRGAWQLGQVQHDGDWNPRPYAMPRLLKDVADRFGIAVYDRPLPVRLTGKNLGGLPILFMTGHYAFHLSDAERAALKDYLDHGGFLWAEACCGRKAFDAAFRNLVKQMFPDAAMEELKGDHPILSGKVGVAIPTVTYSPAVQAESPDLKRPVLWGLARGGHLVLVYSPYGLAPGLDGIKTYGARTLAPEDAHRLALNILLYVMQEPAAAARAPHP